MDIYVSDYILGEGAKNGIPEYSLEKERIVGKNKERILKWHLSQVQDGFGTDAGIYLMERMLDSLNIWLNGV